MSQLGTPGHLGQIGHSNTFHRPEGSGARNESERICLILNPRAGAGAAGDALDTVRRAAERAFAQWEIRTTEGPGHAAALAAQASAEDFHLVAAVGGDGTCHEVINGMMADGRAANRKQAFALIPFGTGSDLQKTLQVPRRLSEALWIAATGMSLPTDVGRAELTTDGGPRSRYFINVAGFGANGEVVRRVNAGSKRLGGRATFLRASLQTAATWRPPPVRLAWESADGAGSWEGRLLSCFLANGAWCGGGMWVGRGGTMHDGRLDLSVLPDAPLLRQLADIRRLYDGHLERVEGAVRRQVTALQATAREGDAVGIDLDGELAGWLPARFELLPRALHVRGGWVRSPLLDEPKALLQRATPRR